MHHHKLSLWQQLCSPTWMGLSSLWLNKMSISSAWCDLWHRHKDRLKDQSLHTHTLTHRCRVFKHNHFLFARTESNTIPLQCREITPEGSQRILPTTQVVSFNNSGEANCLIVTYSLVVMTVKLKSCFSICKFDSMQNSHSHVTKTFAV